MSILSQDWNGHAINFTNESFVLAKREIPKGYVNASQMCKANGKHLFHWNENKRSKAFVEALSRSIGFPIDRLIIEIFNDLNENRGTWVHRRIAINIAQWISPEFDVWVATQIETLMDVGKVELITEPSKVAQQSSSHTLAQEAALLAETIGRIAGISPALSAQMAVNAAIAVAPVLEPARDSLKVAVACTDTHADTLLNASQVGKLIKLSPVRVNELLIEKGFQYRTNDRKAPYRPTEEGKRYGRVVPAIAKHKDQTVFQLRWMPEISSVIS